MANETTEKYTKVAIALHWIIGLAIIFMLGLGLLLDDIPDDYKFQAYQFHKSLGLTILALSFVRLFWRLTHRSPALPAGMKTWEIWASKLTHYAFYIMMIGIPLTGWALVSASPLNFPIMWFGVFEWPHLPFTPNKELSDNFSEMHELLAYLTIVLLGLHIGAALKHHFISKDNVLTHMLPFLKQLK
jgi:cytochrome b561